MKKIVQSEFFLLLNFFWDTKDNLKLYKYAKMIKVYYVVQELCAFLLTDHDWPDWCLAKPRYRFGYQCLDNVKMYKYAKLDQNIPCGSRVISIWPRLGWLMLGKASSPFCILYQWLDSVEIDKYPKFGPNNIPRGSELWAFSLTDHTELDLLSKASSLKSCCAFQWLENVDMHMYAQFDHNIPCVSRVMGIFTNWPSTDSNSDYSAHFRVMQSRIQL